jgi:hypothetical protein
MIPAVVARVLGVEKPDAKGSKVVDPNDGVTMYRLQTERVQMLRRGSRKVFVLGTVFDRYCE